MMRTDDQKRAAALAALDLVKDGMAVGLGTGSTAAHFVMALGERVRDGLTLRCAATSQQTERLAAEVGITVEPLDDVGRLDLTVDGADELDAALRLIKGGGAALLREKIVAAASARMAVIADAGKLVPRLGAFPLPVEIVRFGAQTTIRAMGRALAAFGHDAAPMTIRLDADGAALLTDGGNVIVDCALDAIKDPEGVARALNAVPGVVEHGLFIGLADCAFVADGPQPSDVRRIDISAPAR